MDYSILTEGISKRAGINKELFEFSEEKNGQKIHEDDSYRVFKKHESKNHFYNNYQYRENYKQGWKSITFSIPNDVIKEFFGILNTILEENDNELIDLEDIKEKIQYEHEGIISFLSLKKDDVYQVEFARKNK